MIHACEHCIKDVESLKGTLNAMAYLFINPLDFLAVEAFKIMWHYKEITEMIHSLRNAYFVNDGGSTFGFSLGKLFHFLFNSKFSSQ